MNYLAGAFATSKSVCYEQMEYNQFKQNDSLTPLSRAFNEIAVFLKQNDSIARDYNYILQYSNRIDQAVKGNHFSTSAIAHNLKAGFVYVEVCQSSSTFYFVI
jgi:hypothetical protein